jgi:phage shock protein C
MVDRLYRSRDDRMLAGVAGGLAEMWGADPALIRIIWALLVIFTGGVALLVYIVMAIVVPEEDEAWPVASTASAPSGTSPGGTAGAAPLAGTTGPTSSGWMQPSEASRDARQRARAAREEARAARRAARAERGGMSAGLVVGGLLVLLGLFFLAREYLPNIDFDWFWPLVLVGLGLLLLASSLGRGPRSGGPT